MGHKSATSKKPSSLRASSTGELLLEIGSEELPFEFIAPALASLKDHAGRMLAESRLSFRSVRSYGTPRRLVLVVDELASVQEATTKEAMGPSKAVAFQNGEPTKAAIGFATGQGVTVQDLQVRQTPKGEYLYAVRREEGRPATTVLTELLPNLVAKLSFPKSMKWNEAGVRFARPVRWVVALYKGMILPIEVAGIRSGNKTSGHRVLGKGKWATVRDYASYESALKQLGVIVDQDKRREMVQRQLTQTCRKAGVELNFDVRLLDQAVYSTEWPMAVLGSFKSDYLSVPAEILITSMKEHQGFFSVCDKNGELAAHFVAIVNNETKDMSLIQQGNERVLAARLADAKFFFDDDRKIKLQERVKRLAGVTFHQKLGNMAQKQERVHKLVGVIASQLSPGDDGLKRTCERAAELCKADLLTGIVGEFPELQGIMGGEYARHDAEPAAVGQAISEQYLPRSIEGGLPRTRAGQALSLADRLDSIVAFFYVGLVPTGSEDPYALRRHATAIVRIILEQHLRINLAKSIDHAINLVRDQGFKGVPAFETQGRRQVSEFIFERIRHYGTVIHSLRGDVIEAVLQSAYDQPFDLVELVLKMQALEAVTAKPEFDPLIVGFKRAHRLVEKEQWERGKVDVSAFVDPAETELHRQHGICRSEVDRYMREKGYEQALNALVRIKPSIDAFFAAVMVNAEDKVLRNNRLSLLKEVDDLFMSFADFSRIVVQGSEGR